MINDSSPISSESFDAHGGNVISPYTTEPTSPFMDDVGINEMAKILPAMKKVSAAKSRWERCSFSCCSITHYQQFFEVSTQEVFSRVKRASIPVCFTKPFYLPKPVEKPDLYGPFWICTTVVILLAAASNFTDWIYFKSSSDHPVWRANFSFMTWSACLFYAQITIIPLIIWMAIKYCGRKKTLVEIMSLYGYSLVTFIPNVILCSIPLEAVQWISINLTFLISVSFLLRNIAHGVLGGSSAEPASMMELANIVRRNDDNDQENSWDRDIEMEDNFNDVDRTINGSTIRTGKNSKGKIRLVLLAILILQGAFCLFFKIHFFY